jgi:hypothetical protein
LEKLPKLNEYFNESDDFRWNLYVVNYYQYNLECDAVLSRKDLYFQTIKIGILTTWVEQLHSLQFKYMATAIAMAAYKVVWTRLKFTDFDISTMYPKLTNAPLIINPF